MNPLDLRLAREKVGVWRAGRGVSVEEAMAEQLEAENVEPLWSGRATAPAGEKETA